MIIDEYLQPEHWNLPTDNQSDNGMSATDSQDWLIVSANHRRAKASGLAIEQINSNILQICLMLEGMAGFSKVRKCATWLGLMFTYNQLVLEQCIKAV